jgi:hypothetical protein
MRWEQLKSKDRTDADAVFHRLQHQRLRRVGIALREFGDDRFAEAQAGRDMFVPRNAEPLQVVERTEH